MSYERSALLEGVEHAHGPECCHHTVNLDEHDSCQVRSLVSPQAPRLAVLQHSGSWLARLNTPADLQECGATCSCAAAEEGRAAGRGLYTELVHRAGGSCGGATPEKARPSPRSSPHSIRIVARSNEGDPDEALTSTKIYAAGICCPSEVRARALAQRRSSAGARASRRWKEIHRWSTDNVCMHFRMRTCVHARPLLSLSLTS